MRFVRNSLLAVVLLLAYPAWLAFEVWEQSHDDEVRAADAIVVLGAAQYDGRPSPVLRARLEQAAYLYGEGLAPRIIVTGGKREGDRMTEADAGRAYLSWAHQIPPSAILVEDNGRTSFESLRGVRTLASDNSVDSLLLVSDPLHSERIKRIASDLGFDPVYASPASYVELNRSRATKAKELLREVGSLLVYEVLDR